MEKGQNYNHPKKGSFIKVEPIKTQKDIKTVKSLLAAGDNPRNFCLFTLGINTNLRASDLVKLRVSQVINLKPMDEIEIRETKTKKNRRISLNKTCIDSIKKLLDYHQADEKLSASTPSRAYLFTSQRGGPLTVSSVCRMVKQWCLSVNLQGNFGSHTMRKTFGFHQRKNFGVGLPELMVVFGHSSQQQTLDYLCIQPDEIKSIYANEI